MKTTTKIMVSVFLIVLMVGPAYACDDDDACSGGYPPIWQIFKKGKAVHWVDWKDNRRFAIYQSGTPNDPSDDMVLDKETGLVWQRSPITDRRYWNGAQSYCNALTTGGRMGWRLPTVQELESLVDPNAPSSPLLPVGHPFQNVQTYAYWSATSSASNTDFAWIVDFLDGYVGFYGKSSHSFFVWCVRGGQGVDPQ